ncbi:MAG: hypothetical protein PF690_12450 [Deltaproteobacteria bacterium]|jgi:hypothetical protein|nr:hypothetical protein [Deltaproteobacteria bacterium]
MGFNTLSDDYKSFFDYFENEENGLKDIWDNVFFMAFDTEWYEKEGRNHVLSYQVATASRERSKNIIKYTKNGKRLNLVDLVKLGLESVLLDDLTVIMGRTINHVFLVAHNITAEWSALADRDQPYIVKNLMLVRKSPITSARSPINLVIDKSINVGVSFFDTMLLAPASHRSLKKLSALLGDVKKEPIKQYHIENMNLYLKECPDKFQKYALKDTEITLQLFFVLQDALIQLVSGGFSGLYRTLASAAVEGFLNNHRWYSGYLKKLHGIKPRKEKMSGDILRREKWRREKMKSAYHLIKRSYYGGRNESYFVGRTKNYPETVNKLWIDIDLIGCYPTAMALCSRIDVGVDAQIEHLHLKYKFTRRVVEKLKKLKVPMFLINKSAEALCISVDEFNEILLDIPNKKTAWTIRSEATVTQNKLINRWWKQWEKAKLENDRSVEKIIIPGFARVRFKFPQKTQFPCLPIRHERYGLIYALEGETTATATEILLALEMGAKIHALTSLELPIKKDEAGNPIRFTMKYLAWLTQKRLENEKKDEDAKNKGNPNGNPKARIYEKLLKEFANSFYGKFAQSINMKKHYNPATGEMEVLGRSKLSDACTASLVTSLARAALSATLLGITQFNKSRKDEQKKITVISATTDGLLIGVPPSSTSISGANDFYETKKGQKKLKDGVKRQLSQILNTFGCGALIGIIDNYLPIKQMCNSRYEMTSDPVFNIKGNDEIFVIKHIADEVISVKTRGQIGLLSTGEAILLARFNLKPPLSEIIREEYKDEGKKGYEEEYKRVMESGGIIKDSKEAEWIIRHLAKIEDGYDEIDTYPFITLSTFQDILKSDGAIDLIKKISPRQINMDWDWKRKIIWVDKDKKQISPSTVPFENLSQMLRHRKLSESIRYTTKENKRVADSVSKPETVLERITIQNRGVRFRGGAPVTIVRLFLRGMMQEKIHLDRKKDSLVKMAAQLNRVWKEKGLNQAYPKTWAPYDFQNAKKTKWAPGFIKPNMILEEIVEALSDLFGADPEKTKNTLFAVEEFKEHQTLLIGQVISAIIDGPRNGIYPFKQMADDGYLPDFRQIKDRFRQQVSSEKLESFKGTAFIPGGRPSSDFKELKSIFYSLGIPMDKAEKCARSIAPPVPTKRSYYNPGQKRCAEHFMLAVRALIQSDTNLYVRNLQQTLQKFGLSRNRYYEAIKSGRFSPNSIKNTAKNKSQIKKMGKALNLEPTQFIDAMIEK